LFVPARPFKDAAGFRDLVVQDRRPNLDENPVSDAPLYPLAPIFVENVRSKKSVSAKAFKTVQCTI